MSKCNFTFVFNESAHEFTEKAKHAINQANGSLSGNISSGIFSVPTPVGPVKGDYFISGKKIDIAITHKPVLLSCRLIENKLKAYLAQMQKQTFAKQDPVAYSFNIDFKESSEKLIEKAEVIIENAGGTFTGDISSGSFSVSTPMGAVKGNYVISDQTIKIAILNKPLLISFDIIKSKLEQYLKQVEKISVNNGKLVEVV